MSPCVFPVSVTCEEADVLRMASMSSQIMPQQPRLTLLGAFCGGVEAGAESQDEEGARWILAPLCGQIEEKGGPKLNRTGRPLIIRTDGP